MLAALLFLVGLGLALHRQISEIDLWRLAPNQVLFRAIGWFEWLPQQEGFRSELEARTAGDRSITLVRYRRVKLSTDLSAAQLHLLGQESLAALERNPDHPLYDDLFRFLALTDAPAERCNPIFVAGLGSAGPFTKEIAGVGLSRKPVFPEVAVPALITALKAPVPSNASFYDEEWRGEVVRALGSFGAQARSAVPRLIDYLLLEFDPRTMQGGPWFKREAASSLGLIGPAAAEAVPFLEAPDDELGSPRGEYVEEQIAILLIRQQVSTEDEAARVLAQHRVWRVRRSIASWIQRSRPLTPAWIEVLKPLLDDPSEYVRVAVAEVLLEAGKEREACHLALLAPSPDREDSDAWTRVQIMWRFDLDATGAIPQLEGDLAIAESKHYTAIVENYRRLLGELKAGRAHKDSNW